MNIIFLDIDGVLNCDNCYYVDQNHISTPCIRFFLECIRDIQKVTEIKIVISSTWRSPNLADFKKTALELGGKENKRELKELFTYLHKDWATQKLNEKRGVEVQEWLSRHKEVEKYLCIDDDSDYIRNQPLLNTCKQYGFGHLECLMTRNYFLEKHDRVTHVDYIQDAIRSVMKKMRKQLRFNSNIVGVKNGSSN